MTANAPLLRFLPVLFLVSIAALSFILGFNGLYGQDAHEYLRQSQVIFDRLQGLPAPPPGIGDVEFAGGYPLVGALIRFLVGDGALALQLVSWLAAALALWVFERLLALLAPGARADSRWAFAGFGLVFAPVFFRAGLTSMSDGLGLVFALSAFFFGLRLIENARGMDAVFAAVFAAGAISTRFALAGLMFPLGMAMGVFLLERKKWLWALAAIGACGVALLPHLWLKAGVTGNPFGHSMLQHWSLGNFFKATFSNENGLSRYPLPNILYLLYPLAHPAFCLVLPGLFFLFKKTDLALPEKRTLLVCVLVYLIFIGGFPHQNLRFHLPVYALLLLLLFPAWDRFYSYGFIFFRRLTMGILITALSVQIFFAAKYLAPVLSRNRLENTVAAKLKQVLPPSATVFAFDLDVALRSYLPEVQFLNLWERRYEEFPAGSFVLFNEALRPQWQGHNPILNWDFLRENHRLEMKAELPGGWGLWEIE